jgi:hypothetical protein
MLTINYLAVRFSAEKRAPISFTVDSAKIRFIKAVSAPPQTLSARFRFQYHADLQLRRFGIVLRSSTNAHSLQRRSTQYQQKTPFEDRLTPQAQIFRNGIKARFAEGGGPMKRMMRVSI